MDWGGWEVDRRLGSQGIGQIHGVLGRRVGSHTGGWVSGMFVGKLGEKGGSCAGGWVSGAFVGGRVGSCGGWVWHMTQGDELNMLCRVGGRVRSPRVSGVCHGGSGVRVTRVTHPYFSPAFLVILRT